MRQYLVCILSLLVLSVARPDDYGRHKDRDKGKSCLTYQEANDLVQLLFSFTQPGFDPAVLEGRLTEDFIVQSGGFNFLSGQNSTAVRNKDEFIEGLLAFTNTGTVYTVLEWFHDCTSIAVHWVDNSSPAPVLGIEYIVLEKRSHKIKRLFGEFNVGAVLFNAGFPECQTAAAG